MRLIQNHIRPYMVAALGLSLSLMGWALNSVVAFALGTALLCLAAVWRRGSGSAAVQAPAAALSKPSHPETTERPLVEPTDARGLVAEMLAQRRYALLLRSEVVANLEPEERPQAEAALDEGMTFVPAGEVLIGHCDEDPDDEDPEGSQRDWGIPVRVDCFYLDRYPVTNREYLEFVRAGGYEQMAIWDAEILPGVLDFVDQTGHPGPKFWRDGRYPDGLDDHPVVGVSWYEAHAYARWVGKRLPTDPEWEKAGSWPMQLSANGRPQRRYPWGDAMDRARCNLWGSGPSTTVSIYANPQGASIGGAHQLIGNVWEWTTGNFGQWASPGRELVLPVAMKSIRGGAFDTYFDNQATCQFQSGEDPLARKPNVGFRCALGAGDVVLSRREPSDEGELEDAEVVSETESSSFNADEPSEQPATAEVLAQ